MPEVITTHQAADLAGVSPVTIRRWVMKGWLSPLVPNTKPLLFHPRDVQRAQQRANPAYHRALDTLWAQALASTHPDGER